MFFNTDKKNTVKDAKLTVSFSSQAYPPHYAGILHKISEIITKYKESFKEFKRTGK